MPETDFECDSTVNDVQPCHLPDTRPTFRGGSFRYVWEDGRSVRESLDSVNSYSVSISSVHSSMKLSWDPSKTSSQPPADRLTTASSLDLPELDIG